MAFKLTIEEKRRKRDLEEQLKTAAEAFVEARNAFNSLIDKSNDFIGEVKERLQDEFDGKSEAWQGGEHGEGPADMINEWDILLESSDESSVETFENLSEESE